MNEAVKQATKDALRLALTDAYKRGYNEGHADSLLAAASAFDKTALPQVAALLRQMAATPLMVIEDTA